MTTILVVVDEDPYQQPEDAIVNTAADDDDEERDDDKVTMSIEDEDAPMKTTLKPPSHSPWTILDPKPDPRLETRGPHPRALNHWRPCMACHPKP